jgi:hypothetical protein
METSPLCGRLGLARPPVIYSNCCYYNSSYPESKLNALRRPRITFALSWLTVANRGYTARSEESDSRDVQKRMLET